MNALWSDPRLGGRFTEPESRTFDSVMMELGRYGRAVLGAHDEGRDENGATVQEFVCTVRVRGDRESELLIGVGETPTIAAVRCLIDTLSWSRQLIGEELEALERRAR